MHLLRKIFHKIRGYGVTSNMIYIEVQLLNRFNILALVCIPLSLLYCISDYIEGRPILVFINIAVIINIIIGLLLNKYQHYKAGKFILLFGTAFLLTISGFIYKNNAEFLIIGVMVAILYLYNSQVVHIISIVCFCSIVLLIKLSPLEFLVDKEVSSSRGILNIIVGLLSFIIITLLFKSTTIKHKNKIEEQHQEMKKTNVTMEQIIRIIAHDIRSPLNATHSLLEIYKDNSKIIDEDKQNLNYAIQSIETLDDTLLNLLEWSTRNIHNSKKNTQKIVVKDYIKQVTDQLAAQLLLKKINLIKAIPEDLEVYVDPDHFITIVRNILTNAIKFSYTDTIIHLSAVLRDQEMVICIQDHGVGISTQKLENLLGNIQLPSYGTQGERGSGLGLALSTELLEENKGKILINSEMGKGTTFEIYLPATKND